MKRFIAATLATVLAGTFVLSDAAMARDHGRYDRHDRGDRYDHRDRDRGDRWDRHDRRDRWDRYDNRRDRWDRRDDRRHYNRGYHNGWRDRSDWRRGGYVGYDDWHRGRYVDYRSHRHLYAPPRGYEWRRVDDNYVLAAVATGLIAGLIIGGDY